MEQSLSRDTLICLKVLCRPAVIFISLSHWSWTLHNNNPPQSGAPGRLGVPSSSGGPWSHLPQSALCKHLPSAIPWPFIHSMKRNNSFLSIKENQRNSHRVSKFAIVSRTTTNQNKYHQIQPLCSLKPVSNDPIWMKTLYPPHGSVSMSLICIFIVALVAFGWTLMKVPRAWMAALFCIRSPHTSLASGCYPKVLLHL